MAQYLVNYFYDFETQSIEMSSPSGGLNSMARLKVKQSDTIRFTNSDSSYSGVSGGDANKFSPQSFTVSPNTSVTMTVLSNAVLGQDNLSISLRSKTKVLYVEVISSTDTTPTPFDIGSPVIAAELNTGYSFEQFTVRGINAPTSLTTLNCKVSVNGSAPTSTSSTVNLNDIVYVRATSSTSFASTVTQSVTIGGVTNTNTITTKNNANSNAKIYFPKTSRPISLKDVTQFFSAPVTNSTAIAPRNMSAFRRGGLHVPNITENNSVADTNQASDLKLGSFIGSATTVYFDRYPTNKNNAVNVTSAAGTASVLWTTNDWTLGYSPSTKYNVQYRYEITEDPANNDMQRTGVTFSSNTGTPSTYAANNSTFSVNVASGRGLEREYSGTIKIFMKSIINPALVLTTEVRYALLFYTLN